MLNQNKNTLEFNSADYPLSQFVMYDGEEVIAAPGLPTEAEMRVEAIKYIGRQALPTMGRLTVRMGAAVLHGLERTISRD